MKCSPIIKSVLNGLIIAGGLLALAPSACAQQDNTKTNAPAVMPLNEQATADAWAAHNGGKYEAAISNADICIDAFRAQANQLQAKLKKEKPKLPIGEASDEVKKMIAANGLLNDVATCYFIKGHSSEKLGRIEAAVNAYKQAKKYTYARAMDPKGWLWSPADAASDRLEGLK